MSRLLDESSKRLQMALSAAGMVAWEFDAGNRTVEFSANIEDVHAQFHLDEPSFIAELLEHLNHGAGPYRNEFRVVKPDGGVIWIRNQGDVIRDADGRPSRIIGVALDITDRKQTDELLHDITAGA